jgi:hypothetical protein
MKTLSVVTAALALAVAASLAPAIAQEPKLPDDNAWPGISQRVDSGSPNAVTTTPHYEVPIRLRPSCKVARPLGLGPVIHNQSKDFSGPVGDRTEVADPPNPCRSPAEIISVKPKPA